MDCTFEQMDIMSNIITKFNESNKESEKHSLLKEFLKSIPDTVTDIDTQQFILDKFNSTPFYSLKIPKVSKKWKDNIWHIKFTFQIMSRKQTFDTVYDVTTNGNKICIDMGFRVKMIIKYE